MARFRILHVTDLHLESSLLFKGAHDEDALDAFFEFVGEPAARPWEKFDLVLLTGDVCHTGAAADVALAEQTLKTRLVNALTNPANDSQFARSALVPGNHDVMYPRTRSPGNPNFRTAFPHWCLDAYAGRPTPEDDWSLSYARLLCHVARDGVDFFVVGADFTLPRPILGNMWGLGRVTTARVKQLTTLCQQIRDFRPRARFVLACHFDPIGAPDHLLLQNASLLVDAAGDFDVAAILCGHTHLPRIWNRPAVPVLNGGNLCAAGDEPFEAHVIDFEIEASAAPSLGAVQIHRECFRLRGPLFSRQYVATL